MLYSERLPKDGWFDLRPPVEEDDLMTNELSLDPLTLDMRGIIARAADALADAAAVGGAPQTYRSHERELRTLIAVLDEIAARTKENA